MILNQFHCRKRGLWKFKKYPKSQDPQKFIFPLPLGREFQFCLWVFSSVLDVLWGQWIYLKISTESREHIWNTFGKIKYDFGSISWQEKRTLEVEKIYPKHKIPKNLYFPSHLDASLNVVCGCFPSVLDVLWSPWIYL